MKRDLERARERASERAHREGQAAREGAAGGGAYAPSTTTTVHHGLAGSRARTREPIGDNDDEADLSNRSVGSAAGKWRWRGTAWFWRGFVRVPAR